MALPRVRTRCAALRGGRAAWAILFYHVLSFIPLLFSLYYFFYSDAGLSIKATDERLMLISESEAARRPPRRPLARGARQRRKRLCAAAPPGAGDSLHRSDAANAVTALHTFCSAASGRANLPPRGGSGLAAEAACRGALELRAGRRRRGGGLLRPSHTAASAGARRRRARAAARARPAALEEPACRIGEAGSSLGACDHREHHGRRK